MSTAECNILRQFSHVFRVKRLTSKSLLAGVVRLVLMALPQNEWGSVVPLQPFSLYRNLPLMVQGLGVMIPKTLAYVAIAVIAYRELYGAESAIKLKAANA